MKYKKLITNYNKRVNWKKKELTEWLICKTLLIYTQNWQTLRRISHKFANINKLTQIRNCCVTTGYTKGITKKTRYSRFRIRSLAQQGFLYGIRKSS
jgi:ribosomal protein S14